MKKSPLSRTLGHYLLLFGGLMLVSTAARAQMVANADMLDFGNAFDLPQMKGFNGPRGDSPANLVKAQGNGFFSVIQTASSRGVNILWPEETVSLSFKVRNLTGAPLTHKGHAEIISFSTSVQTGDVWLPRVTRGKVESRVPVEVQVAADGSAEIKVTPVVPARYGGYALVFDFGGHGRAWGAGLTRVVRPDEGRVFAPAYALDMEVGHTMVPMLPVSFRKMGIKAARFEAGYIPTTDPQYTQKMEYLDRRLRWAKENNVSVMLTLGAGGTQPLGRGRPWLDEKDVMREGLKEDLAWLPAQDADFQKWTQNIATKYGFPNGPVNAVELWNEPWEGVSISGWGADNIRYREIYDHMARGVLEARRLSGVKVLVGGASSSSNTLDKLFADGSNRYLPVLDFASMHYQGMGVTPALIPAWRNRKSPFGPVRVWDTESWVANSEDRISAVVASMRAMGHDRVMGTYSGNVFALQNVDAVAPNTSVVQSWPAAAASAAVAKFIGERPYRGLLQKGLPWIFAFNGTPQKGIDDGTVVVVGDLSNVYDRNVLMYRGVYGRSNRAKIAALELKLAKLPANADPKVRTQLEAEIKSAGVLEDGSLILSDGKGRFQMLDFYGNRLPSQNGKILVPLNGKGYFLRTDGSKGSFEALVAALKVASTAGYEPIEIVAHDMTAPLEQKPLLRLTLTNILNRPLSGKLLATMSGLRLEKGTQNLRFAPNEVKTVYARLIGKARADNRYPLQVSFNAGKDGIARHSETLSVNYIAKRTVQVDGKLNEAEWRGAVPQVLSAAGIARSQTEAAWLPFKAFDASTAAGQTTAYLAYDQNYFYFAAKTADKTPDAGNVRFATRDDDSYFYPATSYQAPRPTDLAGSANKPMQWPAGVRRFSYRRDPDLPAGNFPPHDNIQLAFNAIPLEKEAWLSHAPGTPPRWQVYPDTDYEYALNTVAPRYGGGTEIWRLQVPGMSRKHFYPRQSKSPFDGPAKGARMISKREGNTRILEAAIPWNEIPHVKELMLTKKPLKFTFRVNDNDGPSYELAQNRSVSKHNPLTFHVDWVTHWANELEWGWGL